MTDGEADGATYPWIPDDAEPLPAEELVDEFLTPLWAWVLEPAGSDAGEAMGELADTVHDGRRPTAEQVRTARRALDRAREVLEDRYAALAEGVEPWGDGIGRTAPTGAVRERLEGAGYTVEYVGQKDEP